MAAAVASMEVPPTPKPKPVSLVDILASPSASGKTVASAGHLFSNEGAPPRSSDGIKDKDSTGKDEAAVAADRRSERDLSISKLFTGDVLDLFTEATRRDLLQALAEDGGASFMTGFAPRGSFVSKEDGDAVQLKLAMPGVGKEHVKIRAEKDVLVVKGESDKDSVGGDVDKDSEGGDDDKGPARYTYRIGLSSHAFKMDQIKAEMKNGVLKVTLPKIKKEERKDVFEIKVE